MDDRCAHERKVQLIINRVVKYKTHKGQKYYPTQYSPSEQRERWSAAGVLAAKSCVLMYQIQRCAVADQACSQVELWGGSSEPK